MMRGKRDENEAAAARDKAKGKSQNAKVPDDTERPCRTLLRFAFCLLPYPTPLQFRRDLPIMQEPNLRRAGVTCNE